MRDNTDIVFRSEEKKVIQIVDLPPYTLSDYDLSDEKEYKRYLFDIERICRNSRSYKAMIEFLREHVSMDHCAFYKNINNLDPSSITIHIHHAPLTLFDIVETIFSKRMAKKEPITVNLVAKEVMYVHYRMMVGLIPLSETVHEIVHNGFLFIPTTHVFGKYKEFVDAYHPYMNSGLLENLKRSERYSATYDYIKETKILKMDMVHLDVSGAYELPKTEEIISLLDAHIKDFDSKMTKIELGSQVYDKKE